MVGQCIAQTQQTQITAVSLDRSELINLILQVPLCGDKASRSAVTCRAGRRASQTAIVHKINIFITNSNMIIKYFKPRVEPTCTSISVGEPTVFRSFCTPPFEFFNRGVVGPNGTTTLKFEHINRVDECRALIYVANLVNIWCRQTTPLAIHDEWCVSPCEFVNNSCINLCRKFGYCMMIESSVKQKIKRTCHFFPDVSFSKRLCPALQCPTLWRTLFRITQLRNQSTKLHRPRLSCHTHSINLQRLQRRLDHVST